MTSKRFRVVLLLIVLFAALAAWGIFSEPEGIPVLNYHQINDRDENLLTVSTAEFEEQMAWLEENGYRTITAAELADALEGKGTLPKKPVLITFDDGYVDNYECAFPILKRHGMKAIIFLISDYVGGYYPNYLTWEQVHEMQAGGVEFGSHTLDHSVLTELSPEEATRQLRDSKRAIERRIGRPVEYLAYPCGYVNGDIVARVKAEGYRAAFTVDFGNAKRGDDPLTLKRVPIFGALPHTLFRFAGRMRCPRLAAGLEGLRRSLAERGLDWMAGILPII